MVVIRIKADVNNLNSEKTSDDDIKTLSKLKLCKLIESNTDQKLEKKIEFITCNNMKDLDNINNINNMINNDYEFLENNKWIKTNYQIYPLKTVKVSSHENTYSYTNWK